MDEARLKLHPLDSVRNFSEALFRLERGRTVDDLRQVLQALDKVMRTPELQSLRRAFGVWVRILLRRKAPRSSISEIERINDIMEADSMLAERIEGWFDEAERKGLQRGLEKGLEQGLKQGLEQGLEKGLQTGEARALRHLLNRRFGPLPAGVEARIEQASLAQVEAWFDEAIDAPSLDGIFGDGSR